MRRVFLFVLPFLLLTEALFAKREFISPIPLPKQYIYSLDTAKCDSYCLYSLHQRGEFFSFLAKYKHEQSNGDIELKHKEIQAELGITSDTDKIEPTIIFEQKTFTQEPIKEIEQAQIPQQEQMKQQQPIREKKPLGSEGSINIAILLPKKVIGRYAITTTRSIMSYLLAKNASFNLEVFDSIDESVQNIHERVTEINSKGFDLTVAVTTKEGARVLNTMSHPRPLFIPTVNKNEIGAPSPNLYFGGLDYKKQLERLLPLTNSKVTIFHDNSPLSYSLNSIIEGMVSGITLKAEIENTEKKALKSIFEGRKYSIDGSSVFLTSQTVKSALALSMLTYHENLPNRVFGMQHLYNPMLFSLTQERDRENLYIANSIMEQDSMLSGTGYVLGADITHDWINYSCNIGVDYFFSQQNYGAKRSYKESIFDGQTQYETEVLKVQKNSFEKQF